MTLTSMVGRGAALAMVVGLGACGDEGGVYPPSADYAARCELPRTGIDPDTGQAYVDQPGSRDDEKTWVRSWIDEYYLWYDDIDDADPAQYPTVIDYFDVLKSRAITAAGQTRDRFHFTYATAEWLALSQAGVEAGFGVHWAVVDPRPPRLVVVAYTDPNTPGAAALARGAEVLTVDGFDVVSGVNVDGLNAGLFPSDIDQVHTFVVKDLGATEPRTVTLSSAAITSQPVQHVSTLDNGTLGYFQFDDHVATAEAQLIDAINQLKTAGVTDLVIDLRYNGGGYLAIASELAYMVAGPASVGRVFERLGFNDKYPTTNPFSGMPLTPTPFLDTSVFAETPAPLPSLGLTRVFVLTGPNTCSASEAVINGLNGIDVEVIQIGSTTCGKPYGFYPQDNCGTTYFSIQFQGYNAKGFGDYADGFGGAPTASVKLPGCEILDDFTHALGDPIEARLEAAIYYHKNGTCPPVAASARGASRLAAVDGRVIKPQPLENRIYRPDRR